MIAVTLGLLWQFAPTQVAPQLKDISWAAPVGKTSRYVVMTELPNYRCRMYIVEEGRATPWFSADGPANGPYLSDDGRWLLMSGWNGNTLYRIGKKRPVISEKYNAGIVRGSPAGIWFADEGTFLVTNGQRILPPPGREFLMIAPQGDIIATNKPLRPDSKGEDRFAEEVELWKIKKNNQIEWIRSLGRHWWDGGSTGVPTLLAVAGTSVALIDQPAGGNALQFPIVVPLSGGPNNSFRGMGLGMTTIEGVPLAFRSGIAGTVWLVDGYAERKQNEGPQGISSMEYGSWWLAWFESDKVRLFPAPDGFLNLWKASQNELGITTLKGGILEFKRLTMPPVDWWSPSGSGKQFTGPKLSDPQVAPRSSRTPARPAG
ncbi:MAG: hypothetical protein WAO58_06190 [Fimbriimonadaceae bacterium]